MWSVRAAILECGASHLAFALLSRSGQQRPRCEQFAWQPLPSEPGREEEWLDHVSNALPALLRSVKHRGPITVVLPGHLVLTKLIKTPRVDAAKREKIIRFEAQQNIPYALADVVWGHAVCGETALDLDVMLCAAKREPVEALCAAIERAGLVPRALVPPAPALDAAGRFGITPNASVLLIDLGARSTTFVLQEPARYHARTLASGGHAVTQQLTSSQDCEFADAEALKISPRHRDLVRPATEAFATRLAQEITRSALHFRRQSGAANPSRVALTGGGARLEGVVEILHARLNVPVACFDALGQFEIDKQAAEAGIAERSLEVSALLGAGTVALAGKGEGIDLLPLRLRSREASRRRAPWFAAAASVAALALLPPLYHFRTLDAELLQKIGAVDAEIAPLRERESRNRANREKLGELHLQLTALRNVHDRRATWQALLADLQDRLGRVEDVWFDRLQLVPASPDSGAPLRVSVSGRMLDKTNPLANVSPDLYRRVTVLLGSIVESPFVSAVENERFDNRQPGILQFDFVLVANPVRPL
jgi:type IV pilus assembly protein PilM